MKRYCPLFLMLLMVIACKKDAKKTTTPDAPKPDNIMYHKLDSNNNTVVSVRVLTRNYQGSGDIPTPLDSTVTMAIDMNGDAHTDFVVTSFHTDKQNFSNCSPHYLHVFYADYISGFDSNNLISINFADGPYADNDSTSIISGDGTWSDTRTLTSLSVGCGSPNLVFNKGYVAVKMGRYYGWIRLAGAEKYGITVKEYAINLTEGNPIRIGQKK